MGTQTLKQASDSEQWRTQTDGKDFIVDGEGNGGKLNVPDYLYGVWGSGAYILDQPSERKELNATLYQSRAEVFHGQLKPAEAQRRDIAEIAQGMIEVARRADCSITPLLPEEYHFFDDEASIVGASQQRQVYTRKGTGGIVIGVLWKKTGNQYADREGIAHEAAHVVTKYYLTAEVAADGAIDEHGDPESMDITGVTTAVFKLAEDYMGDEADGNTGYALEELTTDIFADHLLYRSGHRGLQSPSYAGLSIIGNGLVHQVAGNIGQTPAEFETAITRMRLAGDPTAFDQIAEYLGPERMRIFLQAPTRMSPEQTKELAEHLGVVPDSEYKHFKFTGTAFTWEREA